MTNAVTGLNPGEVTQTISPRQQLILNANSDIVGIQNLTGTGQDFRGGGASSSSGASNTVIDGGGPTSNYGGSIPIDGGGPGATYG